MLSYYRQNVSPGIMLGLKTTEATALTTVPVRTLAITGADDGCIDTRLYDHVFLNEDFPSGFRVGRIQDAGHFTQSHARKKRSPSREPCRLPLPGDGPAVGCWSLSAAAPYVHP